MGSKDIPAQAPHKKFARSVGRTPLDSLGLIISWLAKNQAVKGALQRIGEAAPLKNPLIP